MNPVEHVLHASRVTAIEAVPRLRQVFGDRVLAIRLDFGEHGQRLRVRVVELQCLITGFFGFRQFIGLKVRLRRAHELLQLKHTLSSRLLAVRAPRIRRRRRNGARDSLLTKNVVGRPRAGRSRDSDRRRALIAGRRDVPHCRRVRLGLEPDTHSSQSLAEGIGRLIAGFGRLLQRLHDHGFEVRVNVFIQPRNRDRVLVEDPIGHGGHRVVAKGLLGGQQLVADDTDGEEVGAQIHSSALDLLGRAVTGCPDERRGIARQRSTHAGDAEIEHLEPPVRVDHHVERLDVAVDDLARVSISDRGAQLLDPPQLLRDRDNGAPPNDFGHRFAVDVLEDDVGL